MNLLQPSRALALAIPRVFHGTNPKASLPEQTGVLSIPLVSAEGQGRRLLCKTNNVKASFILFKLITVCFLALLLRKLLTDNNPPPASMPTTIKTIASSISEKPRSAFITTSKVILIYPKPVYHQNNHCCFHFR